MQRAFGLDIPQTLDDVCDPTRLALVVYDMQVGIVTQIENGQQVTDKVVQVLAAARKAGMSDEQFAELMAVVGMANETNRLVSGYQVEIDGRFRT